MTVENFFLSNYEEWKALTFLLETKNAFFENNIVNVYKIVYHDLIQNSFLKTLFETLNIFTRNFLHLRN